MEAAELAQEDCRMSEEREKELQEKLIHVKQLLCDTNNYYVQ